MLLILQRYEFSSKSQLYNVCVAWRFVVADTTKVRIFKQITTCTSWCRINWKLLLILQRYEFSSKSQLVSNMEKQQKGCCWYYKGTNFQANHNITQLVQILTLVVADTTKVRIFKQITTYGRQKELTRLLLLILQRYEFSSKSQPFSVCVTWRYVVADTTKVRIFKQITTH